VQFTDLHERARLEWLDAEDLTFPSSYSNRFYGSCTFVARVAKCRPNLIPNGNSLLPEKYAVKSGELFALVKPAIIFLQRLLLRNPSLEDLGHSAQLAGQTMFPCEMADSVVLRAARSQPFPMLYRNH
jgi:hypothetical protein